jgi:hypothetical protein
MWSRLGRRLFLAAALPNDQDQVDVRLITFRLVPQKPRLTFQLHPPLVREHTVRSPVSLSPSPDLTRRSAIGSFVRAKSIAPCLFAKRRCAPCEPGPRGRRCGHHLPDRGQPTSRRRGRVGDGPSPAGSRAGHFAPVPTSRCRGTAWGRTGPSPAGSRPAGDRHITPCPRRDAGGRSMS